MTKPEIKIMAEYNRRVRVSSEMIDNIQAFVNQPSVFQFSGSDTVICSTFGCPKILSLVEQLAGSKCTSCMNIKPINITNTIKRP